MKFKFLDTISALVGGSANTQTKQIPAGNYSGVRLTLVGTTAVGETLTLDDIATVYVESAKSGQIVRADYGFLNIWQNLRGGFPPTVSGSAETAERVVATIPFGSSQFPNTQNPKNDRELSFKIEFKAAMATRFAGSSATVRVDMIQSKDVVQDYDYIIQTQNQTAQGAGDITDTLTGANITEIFMKEDTNVASVTVRQDGKTIADNTPFGVLRDETNIMNRIESAGQDWVELRSAGFTRPSTRNASTEITTSFTGGATMKLYKFRMSYKNQSEVAQNQSAVAANMRNN